MTTQKELVAQWRALGYRAGMASETITPPPPKEYRRLYHMMQRCWAIVAIKHQRLKVSRLDDLNDPFELTQHESAHPHRANYVKALSGEPERRTWSALLWR
jgi:hypothetical protein